MNIDRYKPAQLTFKVLVCLRQSSTFDDRFCDYTRNKANRSSATA